MSAAHADERGQQQPELVALARQRREHDRLAVREPRKALQHGARAAAQGARDEPFLRDRELAATAAGAGLLENRSEHLDDERRGREQRAGYGEGLLAFFRLAAACRTQDALDELVVSGRAMRLRSHLEQPR